MSNGDDEPKYKMVNGELVELMPEDIAQIERDAVATLPPSEPEPEPQEPDHAKRRTHKR